MIFQNIVGHENVIQALVSSLKEEKVGHAYLFTGPAGSGKKTLARSFATALLCQEPVTSGESECVCQSCRRIRSNAHFDLVTVLPNGNSIKIEQLRELQRTLFLRPLLGSRKVFIFPEAELLTEAAANSFLKLLEEPPPGIIFIFTAVRADHILPTIRSRCQIYQLFQIAPELIAPWLIKQGYSVTEAGQRAVNCQGLPGLALAESAGPLTRDFIGLNELLQLDLLDLLKVSGELEKKERQAILSILREWESEARNQLLRMGRTEPAALARRPGMLFVFILERLTQITLMIENNVSQRLAIDQFFMALKLFAV